LSFTASYVHAFDMLEIVSGLSFILSNSPLSLLSCGGVFFPYYSFLVDSVESSRSNKVGSILSCERPFFYASFSFGDVVGVYWFRDFISDSDLR